MIRGVSVKALQDERYELEKKHYQIHSSSEAYDDQLDMKDTQCDPDCPICFQERRKGQEGKP